MSKNRSISFDVEAFENARQEAGLTIKTLCGRAGTQEGTFYRIKRKGDPGLIHRLWQIVTDRSRRVPIVDLNDASCIVGELRKSLVHKWNLPHRSVIVIVRCGTSRLLCCKRHEDQRSGNRIDSFGEHERVEDEGDPRLTAERVLADELRIGARRDCSQPTLEFIDSCSFGRIGRDYQLPPYTVPDNSADPENSNEWSTLFGLDITAIRPPTVSDSIQAFDETDGGEEMSLKTKEYAIEKLLNLHDANTGELADGMAKVLHQLKERDKFGAEIRAFIQSGFHKG